MRKLEERIVIPAFELARNLRMSSAGYYFSPKPGELFNQLPRPLVKEDLGSYSMIDVVEDRPVKNSTILYYHDDGTFGEGLCVLHPALVRHGKDREIVIRKPVILVKLHRPASKRKGSKDDGFIQRRIRRSPRSLQ